MNCIKMPQVKVPVSPVVIKKGCTLSIKNNDLLRCLKVSSVFREKVIYKSNGEDFLNGEYPNLCLVNRENVTNNRSASTTTIARFIREGMRVERSSAEVIKLIGQKNYDTVFRVLCSVKSEELKIQAILALLTADKTEESKSKKTVDAETQTFDTSQNNFNKPRTYKRIKGPRFKPYIVHEEEKKIKRVVVDPKMVLLEPKKEPHKTEQDETQLETLPDLREPLFNEDSNFSIGSHFSISSSNIPDSVLNGVDKILEQNIEQHTAFNTVPLTLLDGTPVMVCAKPMDKFHYTTPDILRNLGPEDRRRMMFQQAIVDWKYCMELDEDGYLPIHQAVLCNDLDLLERQCAVLKNKHGTVDVMGGCNVTPLQLSIHKDSVECMTLLLRHGADPMRQDDEGRSIFHTAAEVSHRHLQCALDYCKSNARQILMQDDLWDPKFESYPDEKLSKFLLDTICVTVDSAGYTPLMVASKQGNVESTKLLADASPATINWRMPNSGNTALFLAVGAAYMEVSNSTNHSKVPENFMKTIEILVEHGADPSLENHSNTNVTMLLAEFNIVDLSVLIANKLTINTMITDFSLKNDGTQFTRNNIDGLMLFKNSDGKVNITEINPKKQDPSLPSTSLDKESSTKSRKPRTNTNRMLKIIQDDISKAADKAGVPKYVKILPKPTMKFYTHEIKSGKLFKRKIDELDDGVKKVKRTPAILKKKMDKEPGVDGNKVKKTRATLKRNSAKKGKKNNMEEDSKNTTSDIRSDSIGSEIVTVVTTSTDIEMKIANKTLIANKSISTGALTNIKGMKVLGIIHKPTQKSKRSLKILPKANEIKIKTEKNISDDTSGPSKVADNKPPIVIINNLLLKSEGSDSKTVNDIYKLTDDETDKSNK